MTSADLAVKEPIFIVGTGRCGTSILHNMMAEHPRVAFLTRQLNRYPQKPALNSVILDWFDRPASKDSPHREKVFPSEAWAFWDYYVPGFSLTFRDLGANDVTARARESLQRVLPQVLTSRRRRLLIKLSGWTRIGFIKEVMADARIIHIIRDPRAVAASLLQVNWWYGWRGPGQWRWGPLTTEEEQVWQRSGQSFPVLALIQWKKVIEAYQRSLAGLPEAMRSDILEIRYERLCSAKEEIMKDVFAFAHLDEPAEWSTALAHYELKNQNDKWRQEMTAQQQQAIDQALQALGCNRYAAE